MTDKTIRREDYRLVPGSRGPRRDFRITVGLREGWDDQGRVFDLSEAVRTARGWMKRRVEAGLPALSGMFSRGEVTYAWPRRDGAVGSDQEPVAIFIGEAVHAYLGHLPDAEIEAMLDELAMELGAALGQERLYIAFCDRTWILSAAQDGRLIAPTGASAISLIFSLTSPPARPGTASAEDSSPARARSDCPETRRSRRHPCR